MAASIEELAALDRQILSATAIEEWRRGWPVVLAGMFGNGLLSMGFMATGTFMVSLETAFGWSRTEVTLGYAVYPFTAVLFAPLVGTLIDLRGERGIAIIGSLLSGLAFALFATTNGSTVYWVALWALYASINQLIMLTIWSSAVAHSFVVSRGLAMTVALAGSAIAAAIVPMITNVLIEHLGWRGAFVAMGLGGGGGVALVCFFGIPARALASKASAATASAAEGMSVREGLTSAAYLKLLLAIFICAMLMQGLMVHMVPVLTSGGLSREEAVAIAGSLGIGMIIGKLIFGGLLDRLDPRLVSTLCLLALAASFVILSVDGAPESIRLFAVLLFGMGAGGISPLFPYLTSRIFGMRRFGRLYGTMTAVYALANALAPIGASMIFDETRSYHLLLLTAPVALLIPLVAILSLGKLPPVETSAG